MSTVPKCFQYGFGSRLSTPDLGNYYFIDLYIESKYAFVGSYQTVAMMLEAQYCKYSIMIY